MQTLTASELEARLAIAGGPMLVDFWASWCRPCRLMDESMAVLEEQMCEAINFVKVDIDTAQALARRLGIWSIPTLLLHDRGRVIDTISGVHSPVSIREWIQDKLVASASHDMAATR